MSADPVPTTSPPKLITICDEIPPDLTVCTSDHTEIKVHKVVLSIHSSVFRDMFVVGGTAQDQVSVTEDDRTIEGLMRLCYAQKPAIGDLKAMWSIRQAAKKYMMGAIVEARLTSRLQDFIQRDPVRVYAFACRDGYETEAKDAALSSLRRSAQPYVAEFEDISGGSVYRLFQYRKDCVTASTSVNFENFVPNTFILCNGLHSGSCGCFYPYSLSDKNELESSTGCWATYVKSAMKLLTETPYGVVVKKAEIVWPALRAAATCSWCASAAYTEFSEIVEAYAKEVDRLTAELAEKTSFTGHA